MSKDLLFYYTGHGSRDVIRCYDLIVGGKGYAATCKIAGDPKHGTFSQSELDNVFRAIYPALMEKHKDRQRFYRMVYTYYTRDKNCKARIVKQK